MAVPQASIRDVGRRFLQTSDTRLIMSTFDRWYLYWDKIRAKNDRTVFCFHRWRTHKLKCHGFYKWVDVWCLTKALRNLSSTGLFPSVAKNAVAIRSLRIFGVETRAACRIQRAYRSMRNRDLALMEVMGAKEDVVAFKARRQRSALYIQCCSRIWMARKRYDARVCAHFMVYSVLMGQRLARGIAMSNQRRALTRIERAELIRQSDEKNDFILCERR